MKRLVRVFVALAVGAAVFGFGEAGTLTHTGHPIAVPEPPCVVNDNCGTDGQDYDQYIRELRATCDGLWSRGENSPECDALNQ